MSLVLHLYCVVPAGTDPMTGLRGIDGAPVTPVRAAGIAVWTSSHGAAPTASIEAARAHHRVVAAAMNARMTPVPLRFGQGFTDPAEAVPRIEERAAEWRALLEQLAGHAEYGVRLTLAGQRAAREMHPSPAPTGTGYMTALAQRERTLREEAAQLDAACDAVVASVGTLAAQTRRARGRDGSVEVAQLVAWAEAAAYHSVIESARGALVGVEATVTGPWPPWTFVA